MLAVSQLAFAFLFIMFRFELLIRSLTTNTKQQCLFVSFFLGFGFYPEEGDDDDEIKRPKDSNGKVNSDSAASSPSLSDKDHDEDMATDLCDLFPDF